jgi:hypothetical protein
LVFELGLIYGGSNGAYNTVFAMLNFVKALYCTANMDTLDTDQSRPKVLWRFKYSRSQTSSSDGQTEPYCGFGWDAPFIDFYDNGTITEFAPLSDILKHGPDKVMSEAFKKMAEEQFTNALPNLGDHGRRKIRRIHLPANNMEWAEVRVSCPSTELIMLLNLPKRVVKCVWRVKKLENAPSKVGPNTRAQSKDQVNDSSANSLQEDFDDMADIDNELPMCLNPEYWRDQQRGCLEHFSSHPLYARHMIPFFAQVPTSMSTLFAIY